MFHFLKEKGIQVVLVNPHHVKKSKELDDNSPTKNDIKDAKVVASLVRDGRYTAPQLPEGIYADLRVLMNQRDRIYEDLHRVKGRIHNWLDRFFPEYMQVFKGWEGKASLLTLQNFPLPQDVVAAGETVIVSLWKEEIKCAVGTKRAQLLCSTAARSIGITAGSTAARHELAMYLELYTMLVKQMDDLMTLVEQLVQQIPGAVEMMTIPGIGLNTVAGFLSEVGDLSRYDHSQQIVSHAGLNLRENSSGLRKGQTTITKRGRYRLRALLYRAVLILVTRNPEFRALHTYFKTRSVNPLKRQQSMITLCNKLIRVMFELGRKQKIYDASKVLGAHRETQLGIAA